METLPLLPSNKKQKKRYLFLSIILLILIALVFFLRQIYLPLDSSSEKRIIFQIEKGQEVDEIAARLKKEGIIRSPFVFKWSAFLFGVYGKLQAGVYYLSPAMSVNEILKRISRGDILKEKITIIEGWSIKDIGEYFEERGICQADKFVSLAKEAGKELAAEFSFLASLPPTASLEGYLFPDTYEIKKDEDPKEIIKKMVKNFEGKVILNKELAEKVKTQGWSLNEIVTMASLLEKEVRSYEDKQLVAGILWKRLKNNWPLQVDSTLTYLTGRLSRELTKEDLKIDSPYNTYKHLGLPPAPIANPGLESIRAAVYYKNSDYWFYLTNDKGETFFSKTLEEHNAKVKKYLR